MNIPRFFVIPTLLLALSLGACSKKQHESESADSLPIIKVHATTVEAKPHIAMENVIGSVRAKLYSSVVPKATGRIEMLAVAPGRHVKKGEVLVLLDAKEIQARLDQARALRDQSEKDLARYRQLLASKVTTQAEFDKIQAANQVAIAALAEAETNFGYLTVTAPFDGVITKKLADVGDLASPSKAVLEMEDPSVLRFEADVPEAIIGFVELGAKMTVCTGSVEVTGTVSEIAPVADEQSRTFLVKLYLSQTKGIHTGQFGRVAVPVSQSSVPRVPASALIQRGQMEIIFVAVNGRAQLRLVKSGKHIGSEVELVSGVENNEQVVTENANHLKDGQPVEVLSK